MLTTSPPVVSHLTRVPPLGLARAGFYRRDLDSGNATYVVVFTERGRQPYRKWITLRSAHASAAQKEAYNLALSWHQGTYDPWEPVPEDMSLRGAATAWMDAGRERWSEATIRGRRGVLDLFLREYPGRQVAGVATADIERFLSRASINGVSRGSYLRVLNTFFRWCVRERYLDKAPTEDVERAAGARGQVAYFTREELQRFIEAAEGYYAERRHVIDRAGRGNFIWINGLVQFAVATGLRKGELRHLRWGDAEAGRIFTRSYSSRWQSKATQFNTKHGSDRIVPLFPVAAGVLAKRRTRRTSENPEEPVFLGPSGRRLGESQINKVFRQVRSLAGLPDALDVHACRHTFASWLLSEGETLYRVSRWMGHKQISVTADLYGHFTESTGEVGVKVFS